jgi:putative FmdB family regulatory protein
MPIYEYECPSCSHRFEKLVRIGAEPPPCPECEGTEVRKLVSASGFILKGGGWYKDGYGLNSAKKSDGAATKSESKPAAATPAPAKKD